MFCEDKRKYAYEKAIEAYWKHVDRYHTWMNYYALFNGALFVGFCTLLCATNLILTGKGEYNVDNLTIESGVVWLKNDYGFLQILLCVIGLISAIAWYCSILGHEKWEGNWMNIISFYEDIDVYKILMVSSSDMENLKDESSHQLIRGEKFKAYSTHKITKFFVFCIAIGWALVILLSSCPCLNNIFAEKMTIWHFFSLVIITIGVIKLICLILFYIIFISSGCDFLYSDVEGKYWINKNKI